MNVETKKHDRRARTNRFAFRIIRLCATLQKLGAEFISKLESTTQEMDEALYWLELLVEAKILPTARLSLLQKEANELMSVFVASVRTAKRSKA